MKKLPLDPSVERICELTWKLSITTKTWSTALLEYQKGTLADDFTELIEKLIQFAEDQVQEVRKAAKYSVPQEVLDWFSVYQEYLPSIAESEFLEIQQQLRDRRAVEDSVRQAANSIQKLNEPLQSLAETVSMTQAQLQKFTELYRKLDNDY